MNLVTSLLRKNFLFFNLVSRSILIENQFHANKVLTIYLVDTAYYTQDLMFKMSTCYCQSRIWIIFEYAVLFSILSHIRCIL